MLCTTAVNTSNTIRTQAGASMYEDLGIVPPAGSRDRVIVFSAVRSPSSEAENI